MSRSLEKASRAAASVERVCKLYKPEKYTRIAVVGCGTEGLLAIAAFFILLLGGSLILLRLGQFLLQLLLPGLAGGLLLFQGVNLALGHRSHVLYRHAEHRQQHQKGHGPRQHAHHGPTARLSPPLPVGMVFSAMLCHGLPPYRYRKVYVRCVTNYRPG